MYHSFGVKRAINFGIFTFCKFVFDINRIFHPSLRSRLNYSIYISNKLTKSKNPCRNFITLYNHQNDDINRCFEYDIVISKEFFKTAPAPDLRIFFQKTAPALLLIFFKLQ